MRYLASGHKKEWLAALIILVAVIFCWPALHQAWLINVWSVQYSLHALDPLLNPRVPAEPPAGHARAAFWLASSALHAGDPALAESLVGPRVAQGDPLSEHLLADILLAQGDYENAFVIWKREGDFNSLIQSASQAQQAGLFEVALLAYQTAWTLDPESGTLSLANFLAYSQQDYSTAEILLRSSLETFPKSSNWAYWSNSLGNIFRTQKKWEDAIAAYQSTIIKFPANWEAYIGTGWTKYDRGDGLEAAITEFQRAINIPASMGYGQLAMAQVLTREKRFEEADVWFVEALSRNPEAQGWYVARANVARQAGNLALALSLYQETLTRFPDYAYAYYEIAYAFQLNDQPDQAISAIGQAVELMSPPNIYYYLREASIFEWVGDKNGAVSAYHQALLIDPQNTTALNGVERLENNP